MDLRLTVAKTGSGDETRICSRRIAQSGKECRIVELVQDWFRVWEDRPGIWVIEEPLHSECVKSNLIVGRDRAVLIDTGMGVGDIRKLVMELTRLPVTVVQSHAHNDHIGGT